METIIYGAVLLLLGVCATFVLPLLRQKLGEARFDRLCRYAKVAVKAAEQLLSDQTGEEKSTYVKEALKEAGFLCETEVQLAVEAAVLEEKQAKKEA